jgi:chorismate mutase
MAIRGIRGATVVKANRQDCIVDATQELLQEILDVNSSLTTEDIASVLFTMTEDLTATYPALAARLIGWTQVPMMCAQEIPVPGGLPLCIRILVHWNTDMPQSAIRHVYLHGATKLRPDIKMAEA